MINIDFGGYVVNEFNRLGVGGGEELRVAWGQYT